jgi:hypothetical protein
MKNFQTSFTAVFIAAVLFSCGGSTQENGTEHAEGHQHATTPTSDTAVIEANQNVYFAKLKDGDVVKSPLVIHFGVAGMEVQSIDSGIHRNKGHHHLLIDTMTFLPAGQPIPVIDDKIIHYGKAQRESKPIVLKPGKHTLALQFADGVHRSYGIKMSKSITVTVK